MQLRVQYKFYNYLIWFPKQIKRCRHRFKGSNNEKQIPIGHTHNISFQCMGAKAGIILLLSTQVFYYKLFI